ncbi:MAG: single-stranded-DNA-specific exonuclease RecJ [Prochloron sp. SP5CPC1]|nr:single-stranded-DNA-specific exonuclease RecJ [Candidatus Paraprochloron terpiosi SP5CPC1]
MTHRLPPQRWYIAPQDPAKTAQLVSSSGMSDLIAQVLVNRGIDTPVAADIHINPESLILPQPTEEFADLAIAVDLLQGVIASGEKIAICGDYDADGMTSTALLLRALKYLGAQVDYRIPNRMSEGYGINEGIVEEFAADTDIALIITVDNGISAFDAIQRARDLGLDVIITDHHDIPEQVPPANAILNPKLLSESSPYRGLAGVGVAYILAETLATDFGKLTPSYQNQLLELFTLGTIADLAPLVGVNRRWLKQGLGLLPKSKIPGIQALMQKAGIDEERKKLQPEDIGFKLGPRINAVGRIGSAEMVISLLTTEDMNEALELASGCEELNSRRQELCKQIEYEALTLVEGKPPTPNPLPGGGEGGGLPQQFLDWYEARVLVLVQPNWHHGVIGIVASRLKDRYGVPVFIGTYEDDEKQHIRGSARGIKEFHVFEALDFCKDLLGKFGGHKAAGGFSMEAANLEAFQEKLSTFAISCLEPEHLKPLVEIDAIANFSLITPLLFQEIDQLHPWGIQNEEPVFWTPNVAVREQEVVRGGHLKLILSQGDDSSGRKFKAIAWRWREYYPLPSMLDVTYKLRQNTWNGNTSIELELVGVRACTKGGKPSPAPTSSIDSTPGVSKATPRATKKAAFEYKGRSYVCSFWESLRELRIRNLAGKVLVVKQGEKTGLLGTNRENAQEVRVTKASPYYSIIMAAKKSLNI